MPSIEIGKTGSEGVEPAGVFARNPRRIPALTPARTSAVMGRIARGRRQGTMTQHANDRRIVIGADHGGIVTVPVDGLAR
ncbi:MAG: hypothetical protein ACE5EC_05235, partial [Phycisphaerae bacterium]